MSERVIALVRRKLSALIASQIEPFPGTSFSSNINELEKLLARYIYAAVA
jgi:hypothetical protein